MSRPFDPHRLQFYMTIPSPCPYLPGRLERKLFTQLDRLAGPQLNDYLTHAGFRRSQNVIYRPACESCQSCKSLRVVTGLFSPNRRFRRILRRNADITRHPDECFATREQFDLLSRYLSARHAGGGMETMDFPRYELMIEECASSTELVEYRDADGALVACVLVDGISDGLSMVYSFFDPELRSRSLGNYMILDQIARCREIGLAYLYLGYWVSGSPKMDYKIDYQPAEVLGGDGWRPRVRTND